MKRWLMGIIVFILAVTAVGCSKTVEQQIGEQLELDQKYLINDDAEAMVFVETASKVISDGYDETDNLFASSKEVLEYLTTTSIESGEWNKADGVTQMSQRSGMDIEFTEENGSGYTEEELEKFTAGYRAAMRYPEGEVKKMEPIDFDTFLTIPSVYWSVCAEKLYGENDKDPEIIDCGDYYEVTNCIIEYPYIVPDEIFEQFKDGFEFDLSLYDQNGRADTIHNIVNYKDGDWILSNDGNPEDDEARCVEVEKGGKKVVTSYYYDGVWWGVIYRGSLFFRKDCIVHDTRFAEMETFDDYVTNEHPGYGETWFQGGKTSFYTIGFKGKAIFDPYTGMIVECQEIYQP